MDIIFQTWYVSGFIIGLIMLTLTYFGKSLNVVQSSLHVIMGAGKELLFF
jgi:hypothetical protein